jgi:hypothetical protein
VSTIEQPVKIDGDELEQYISRAVNELGATLNAAPVVMGDKLGLYRAVAAARGLSSAELRRYAGRSSRTLRAPRADSFSVLGSRSKAEERWTRPCR